MSKKKIALLTGLLFIVFLLNLLIFRELNFDSVNKDYLSMQIELEADKDIAIQVYHSNDLKFDEGHVCSNDFEENMRKEARYSFDINDNYIRIDFGGEPSEILLYNLSFKALDNEADISPKDLPQFETANQIDKFDVSDSFISIVTNGNDPFVVFDMSKCEEYNNLIKNLKNKTIILDIIVCAVLDIVLLVVFLSIKKEGFFRELYDNRRLVMSLSKNDFKTKFAGSFLGIVWAFIQPVVTILVYWFVFQVGLKNGGVSGYPFILWLMAGLVPWFFFSEALNGGTNSLMEYNYLVKKVVFNIDILPMVKIISSIYVHLFFTAFIMILCWCYGYRPDLFSLQIIYYIGCTFVFVLGISYLTSAVVCFFKDLTQIINIILQVGIWLTPIMWDVSILSPKLEFIFKLNPMYYIVDGFRDALLYKTWVTEKLWWTVYFWIFTILIFKAGTKVFKKLKVHFADIM